MRNATVILACLALLALPHVASAQPQPARAPKDTAIVHHRTVVNLVREERRASRDSLLAQLSAAQERWQRQGSPRLSFRVKTACSCLRGVLPEYATVEAAGDSILSLMDQRGQPTRAFYPADGRPSIGWLFAYAEEAIRGDAERVVVTFDSVLGIPTRILLDPVVFASDDEIDVTVSHILPRAKTQIRPQWLHDANWDNRVRRYE